MSTTPSGSDELKKARDEGFLDKIAHILDPGGREISDAELIDPGANIHDEMPEAEREKPGQNPPGTQGTPGTNTR